MTLGLGPHPVGIDLVNFEGEGRGIPLVTYGAQKILGAQVNCSHMGLQVGFLQEFLGTKVT